MSRIELCELYSNLRKELKDENGKPMGVNKFASMINIPAPRISEIEHGKREMTLTELKAYHNYFGVSFEYLLGETDIRSPEPGMNAACKYTGINEQAILRIKKEIKDLNEAYAPSDNAEELFFYILNKILSSDSFYSVLHQFFNLQTCNKNFLYNRLKEIFEEYLNEYYSDCFWNVKGTQYYETALDVHRYKVNKEIEKVSDLFDYREICTKLTLNELLENVGITKEEFYDDILNQTTGYSLDFDNDCEHKLSTKELSLAFDSFFKITKPIVTFLDEWRNFNPDQICEEASENGKHNPKKE